MPAWTDQDSRFQTGPRPPGPPATLPGGDEEREKYVVRDHKQDHPPGPTFIHIAAVGGESADFRHHNSKRTATHGAFACGSSPFTQSVEQRERAARIEGMFLLYSRLKAE